MAQDRLYVSSKSSKVAWQITTELLKPPNHSTSSRWSQEIVTNPRFSSMHWTLSQIPVMNPLLCPLPPSVKSFKKFSSTWYQHSSLLIPPLLLSFDYVFNSYWICFRFFCPLHLMHVVKHFGAALYMCYRNKNYLIWLDILLSTIHSLGFKQEWRWKWPNKTTFSLFK